MAVEEFAAPGRGKAIAVPRPRPRRWSLTVPVRLRITVAVVIFAGMALAGAGITVYAVQAHRLDENVTAAISQEIAEFETLTQRSDDTGSRYATTKALLTAELRNNVPNDDELILAFWDGAIQRRIPGPHDDLVNDPDFEKLIADMATDGGMREVETRFGDVRVAVKPVQGPGGPGAAVFAYFMGDIRADLASQMRSYAVVAGLALLAVAVGAYLVAGRLLRPVRNLRDTARDITHSDLTRRIIATGNDDLTDLTTTFNAMLDRLEGAFSTQRQFLDDAGHELKTPITIVRGHLELMRESDALEVAATRELVLDEMDRMARLVEELTLLAKSRRPDFLRRTDTDVGALTGTLINKMRGLSARRWVVD
ncbi:MAG: HAMP domain-containing protein [Actinomycetota bacterium]|nr:HAMP domain-containing protein [Actinomycetota bacterium]